MEFIHPVTGPISAAGWQTSREQRVLMHFGDDGPAPSTANNSLSCSSCSTHHLDSASSLARPLPFGSFRATPWRCLAPGALGRGRDSAMANGVPPRGGAGRPVLRRPMQCHRSAGRAGLGWGPSRHAAKAREGPPVALTRTRTAQLARKTRKTAFVIDHTRIKCIWMRGQT